ncbi:MAG TPA: AAA family ATPase [Kribbellaceae bacterium]|nr:AAA family ATPase [Kribbellaceae bacterium]
MHDFLVGRDDLIAQVRTELDAGGSVILFGPAGIGKSAVARAVIADRSRDGVRVLTASPSKSESALPYVTLLDLLSPVWESVRDAVPPHLRQPLEVALLKSGAPDSVRDELAVRLAVLQVLRRLATMSPVLVVIDDIQWVDPSSLEVLAFCARRVHAGVQMLVTEQVAAGDSPSKNQASPDSAVQVEVPGLQPRQVSAMLRTVLGEALPARTLQRIHDASGGNPFLALELGRAVLRHADRLAPDDPLPVSSRLKSLLGDRLSEVKPSTREVLLAAASSPRPTVQSLARACGPVAEAAVADAERLGLVEMSGTSVRFRHSLLREYIYAEATSEERREAHRQLAGVVDEPVEQVRHLALATQGEDAGLARRLDDAATAARDRGAPGTAARLARLAADRTPFADRESQAERLLQAARDAQAAGLVQESSEAARLAVRVAADVATRTEARLVLIENETADRQQRNELLEQAFADAEGNDLLEAKVRVLRATGAYFDRRLDDAREDADTALELSRRTGDAEVLLAALAMTATLETLTGDGADTFYYEAGRLAQGRELTYVVVGARQMAAMAELFQGRLEVAYEQISTLLDEVRRSGAVSWLFSVLISATAINERSGRSAEALLTGSECARLGEDIGDEVEVGQIVAARGQLSGGSVAEGVRLASEAVQRCRENDNNEWLPIGLVVLGLAKLLEGDTRAAGRACAEAAELDLTFLVNDPAVIAWQADFVEVLVAAGELEEAERTLRAVRERADKLGRTVIDVPLRRADALRVAKAGDAAAALVMLDEAVAAAGEATNPLDLARCELARARVARQARRRSLARSAYASAIEQLEALGAVPWRDIAAAELARLDDPGRQGSAELSDAERTIVEMLHSGATNREIAGALYLSVKAVESQLTRLYRRFNVRNRTQLLRAVDPRTH